MAMDFLNEENKDNLIIKDLEKLGKVLYHENDSFKLALKHQLREKALAKPQIDFKKIFSLKWVWVTAPAALLIFVMLAEASEYAGLEIKPYHYLKTTALPAVSKQVKRVATTVAKKIETIAASSAEKKPIHVNQSNALSTASSTSFIAFEPLTDQEKKQFIQETYTKLAEESNLQTTYSGQQAADFLPQKLAYDTSDYYQKGEGESKPTQKQIVKDKIINQGGITKPTVNAISYTEPQNAKDITNNQKEFLREPDAENFTTPQKSLPEETKPNLDAQQKNEEPDYKLPVQSQPKSDPANDINIAKVQPTPPITTVKESATLSKPETIVYNEFGVITCQNKTEIIVSAKNIQEATEKINNILYDLGITITEKKFSSAENNITITASLDQYNKLIQAVKNAALDLKENIITKQNDCGEISTNIYLRKKPSLLEKWLPFSLDKSLR